MAKLPGGALAARVGPTSPRPVLTSVAGPSSPLAAKRQHGHSAAGVVGHEDVLARRVNAEMRGAGAFGADRIEQREVSVGAVDRVGAHGPGVGALVGRGLVGRVEAGSRRIQRQPGRVGTIGEDLALDQGPAGRVHFEEVDALPVALAPFRSLRRTIGTHIGKRGRPAGGAGCRAAAGSDAPAAARVVADKNPRRETFARWSSRACGSLGRICIFVAPEDFKETHAGVGTA